VRLAFLAPEFLPPVGGVGIYSVHLVKDLSKERDTDIHVFAPSRGRHGLVRGARDAGANDC